MSTALQRRAYLCDAFSVSPFGENATRYTMFGAQMLVTDQTDGAPEVTGHAQGEPTGAVSTAEVEAFLFLVQSTRDKRPPAVVMHADPWTALRLFALDAYDIERLRDGDAEPVCGLLPSAGKPTDDHQYAKLPTTTDVADKYGIVAVKVSPLYKTVEFVSA